MKAVLLLGIVAVCVLSSSCRPTDCNKSVMIAIGQIREKLDELENIYRDESDSNRNKIKYNATTSVPSKYNRPRKHNKHGKKHGSHCKITHEEEDKIPATPETTPTSESTTIDYITEQVDIISATNAENLMTELPAEVTVNPITLRN